MDKYQRVLANLHSYENHKDVNFSSIRTPMMAEPVNSYAKSVSRKTNRDLPATDCYCLMIMTTD